MRLAFELCFNYVKKPTKLTLSWERESKQVESQKKSSGTRKKMQIADLWVIEVQACFSQFLSN